MSFSTAEGSLNSGTFMGRSRPKRAEGSLNSETFKGRSRLKRAEGSLNPGETRASLSLKPLSGNGMTVSGFTDCRSPAGALFVM
jgi:hypothetical protein